MRDVTPLWKQERKPKKPKRMKRVGKKMTRDRAELRDSMAQVLLRSKGRCEIREWPHDCQGLATQFHHVKRRSQGGDNTPANLLHVCTNGHARIHAFPVSARLAGFLA